MTNACPCEPMTAEMIFGLGPDMPKTYDERRAIQYQEDARMLYHSAPYHVATGEPWCDIEDQAHAAHCYRMARAYMGVTNGDVKKAEQS